MKKRHRVVFDIKPNAPVPLSAEDRSRERKNDRSFFTKNRWAFIPAAALVSFSLFGSVVAPVTTGILAQSIEEDEERDSAAAEREELEAQLRDLERQMAEYEKTITEYRRQGTSLKSEIGVLDAQMKKLDLKIQAISVSLQRLDGEIVTTTSRIGEIERDIEDNKEVLSSMVRRLNEYDEEGLVEVLLRNPQLSDFFGSVNDLFAVQDGVNKSLAQLAVLRAELMDQKEELVLERTDADALKIYQRQQREEMNSIKGEKNTILKVTQGKESEYQKLLTETKKTAAEIRSRIFRLVGGGELPFGEAYELAKIAQEATGIRAAFILSILTQESGMNGVIGSNLGKCYYNEPRDNVDGAVMRKREQTIFVALMEEIGRDPATTPVSCPIVSDGAYGGAMGPAQFMPSTWSLYKNRIQSVTGNKPPSPFNNLDAIVGTSLYLKDAYNSAACIDYKDDACRDNGLCSSSDARTLLERCAAAKYYAGSRWYNFRWAYGEPVVNRAEKFQKDIDVLESR